MHFLYGGAILAIFPWLFVWHFWHEARTRDWRWTTDTSRTMYVDSAKTLITASGIAVALLASSAVSSIRSANNLVSFSVRFAVVCLIVCVCTSFIVILALTRGFERALSRNLEEQRRAGNQAEITEGKLELSELALILIPAGIALSCFLVGFLFLGRIVFHF